ncbi:hypothetical protein FB45DRAFT_1078393 [Roridomyces roridus]|uniref:Uncharacterized protein n=1 Tax=Roridomyces roridus TaxID=1738132 RepID=A0AAD7FZD8_9AGAR|nr:hypothetical protein FB45DRAFT_1078393 [Roridomyces roridus]
MLPDEIISEILSPALKVSEELFSDTSDVSPFSNYTPSTSDYLLVCKDWLRVATPLLYNVVVLRSKAQTNTLQQVLKTNPEFGLFIKKLRVEGGFGTAMHTILKSAPNITDLSITLSIYSSDGAGGLCKGLPLINPHRIIIVDPHVLKPLKNKHLAALKKTLFDCIRSWSNLRIFGYPHSDPYYSHMPQWAEKATELSQLLAQTQVHTVTFGAISSIPYWIAKLYGIPSLRVLQFQRPLDEKLVVKIESDAQLNKLAKYKRVNKPTHIEPDIAPSLNPFFVPMQFASQETREAIWKHVIFFAIEIFSHRSDMFRLLQSLIPYGAGGITRTLDKEPHLGPSIRRIFTATETTSDKEAILKVLRHTTCLKFLAPAQDPDLQLRITSESFEELGKVAGHSLEELSVSVFYGEISSPSDLQPFTNLCVLDIEGIRLSGIDLGEEPPSDVLKTVQNLRIRAENVALSFTLVELFANISVISRSNANSDVGMPPDVVAHHALLGYNRVFGLDSLRTLVLPRIYHHVYAFEDMIKMHGEKLHHLTLGPLKGIRVLDFCPNLTEMKLLDRDDLGKLAPNSQHHALVKISSPGLPKDADPEEVEAMLDMYPNLREIEFRYLQWPTTEREISKSSIVPLAESFTAFRGLVGTGSA